MLALKCSLSLTVAYVGKIMHIAPCVCFINKLWMVNNSSCTCSHALGSPTMKAAVCIQKKKKHRLHLQAVEAEWCTYILPLTSIYLIENTALIITLPLLM